MKLKSQPADFRVAELTEVRASGGPFALYELSKESLGTPEAVSAILRLWNLPRDRISYGGMKDRHACTTQHLTIFQGPRKDLKERSFRLNYIGQTPRNFTAQDIVGNQFSIRLRGISSQQTALLTQRLESIQQFGLINYFDDQRFGSLGESARFIAEPWCKGDYESALFLALAEPNKHDRPRESQQKAILRQHWGQWDVCKEKLDRSHRRSIVTYLVDHPTGFKRAISLIRSDLRSIYLAAFQSGLWNQWLSRIIQRNCEPRLSFFSSPVGSLAIPLSSGILNSIDDQPHPLDSQVSQSTGPGEQIEWLTDLQLPLPSARQHDWPSEYVGELDAILTELGMERREIRLKYPRDTFFSKGMRACWIRVRDFRFEWSDDAASADKKSLLLEFQLPRGSYATMIVKLLQLDD